MERASKPTTAVPAGAGDPPLLESAPVAAALVDPRYASGWLVMDSTRAYGPYEMVRLASFLTVDHWVFHGTTRDWVKAGTVDALKPVFSGVLRPCLEWYYRPPHGKEQGPFARDAVIRRILDRTIGADALIRHETWPAPRALGETPFADHLPDGARSGKRTRMTIERGSSSLLDRIRSHPRRRESGIAAAALLLCLVASWGIVSYRGEARRTEESENNLYAVFREAKQVPEPEARRLSSLVVTATEGRIFTPQQMNAIMTAVSVAARRGSHTPAQVRDARNALQQSLSGANVSATEVAEVLAAFDAIVRVPAAPEGPRP